MKLYSLYKCYIGRKGKVRWLRVTNEALPKIEAENKWADKVKQTSFNFVNKEGQYSLRVVPKSETRRKITEAEW